MQTFLQQLQTWATPNKMKINTSWRPIRWSSALLQNVSLNTYLTVLLTTLASWKEYSISNFLISLSHTIWIGKHIDAIITKASSRLYFLKILKKSGLNSHQLRHFYLSVIRPILEYCSDIWHHGLTKAQAESLEAIQRRALRITDSSTVGMHALWDRT